MEVRALALFERRISINKILLFLIKFLKNSSIIFFFLSTLPTLVTRYGGVVVVPQ